MNIATELVNQLKSFKGPPYPLYFVANAETETMEETPEYTNNVCYIEWWVVDGAQYICINKNSQGEWSEPMLGETGYGGYSGEPVTTLKQVQRIVAAGDKEQLWVHPVLRDPCLSE